MIRSFRAPSFDMVLFFSVLALLVIGLMVIFSASHVESGFGKVLRQGIWIVAGMAGLFVFSRMDYRPWARYSLVLLMATVVMLIATIILADPINGARSWIDMGSFRLQPSEFSKLAMIVAFAGVLVRFGNKVQRLSYFLRSILFVSFPILLILAQPDFGTAMVMCSIWLVMIFVSGARGWMIGAVCLGAVLLFTAAWSLPIKDGKTLIKDYQKQRLDFIHADPAGNGYHQLQSRIAIGAGEVWGRGYLHGTQAKRGFLPEQDTDFIFAVIGEEFGFIGSIVIIGLYLLIFIRLLRIIEEAETPYGRLIAAGVAAMLAVHVFINIGMCLSLSPVTGVPLPFVSYGGSNVLTNLLAIGVVLNISRHRMERRTWAAQEELVRL